jgi:hypothetical protein
MKNDELIRETEENYFNCFKNLTRKTLILGDMQ